MVGHILVDLEIETPSVRGVFEQIVSAQAEFVLKRAKAQGMPQLLILEVNAANSAKTFSRVQSLLRADPNLEIFLTGTGKDAGILLEALRAGVREFLTVPIGREDVERAFARFKTRCRMSANQTEPRRGKLIAVVGAKGGVGTSTIAVNLAAAIKSLEDGKSIALVDLNFQDADLPLFLDLEPAHSFKDIGDNFERLDGTFLMNVLTRHVSGLYVLPLGYEEGVTGAPMISTDAVRGTLELMESLFDYVLVDCGHSLDFVRRATLAVASSIIVVSTLHVPAIRSTKRLLDLLREAGHSSDKIKLIMNRFEVGPDDFSKNAEEVLSHGISLVMPNDYAAASAAINNGQFLSAVAPQADVTQQFQRLAEMFTESRKKTKEASFLGGYFRSVKEKLSGDHAIAAESK